MPIISLLIPIYNGEPYIQSCLDSLSIQDTNDIEILFLDDKSTDNSLNLIKHFLFHSKFEGKVLSSKKNRGFYRSLKILLRIQKFYLFLIESFLLIESTLCSSFKPSKERLPPPAHAPIQSLCSGNILFFKLKVNKITFFHSMNFIKCD